MLDRSELLKIELLANGMKVSENARKRLTSGGKTPLSLFEYPTTSGITLRLEGTDIFINAPFAEDFCKDAEWTLDSRADELFLARNGEEHDVSVFPLPEYHDTSWSDFAMTHVDRVRITPIQGCAFSCAFCDSHITSEYKKQPLESLLESIQVAIDDPILPARHILISGGTPQPEDLLYMDEVYGAVPRRFNMPVDVMMVPRPDLSYVEKLRSWGINELSINMEIYNEDIARRMIPGKHAVGREHYIRFLEKGVDVFGRGNIRSLLLVGIEPLEDTLKGIEALAKVGVASVLSPFRPAPDTPLEHLSTPTAGQLVEIYEQSREIATRYGVNLGPHCIPCQHNTLTFPDGSDFYMYS